MKIFWLWSLIILGGAVALDSPPLTWESAPLAPINRHVGDWMVAAGWYSPAEIYQPSAPTTFEIGDQTVFPVTFSEDDTQTYLLRYKTDSAYFWFPPETEIDLPALKEAATYFETVTLPNLQALYGEVAGNGIDGDPRLHLVHSDYLGLGVVGLFRFDDQCPTFLCPHSTQRDLIYYSLQWGAVNSPQYRTTLTHEYQHIIRYAQDGNERRWMNEGLSQLGEHLAGFQPQYTVGENLPAFLANPNQALNGWAEIGDDAASYYGQSYLFLVYLYERFGRDFITDLASSPYDGLASVHHTLEDSGLPALDEVFADWIVATATQNYSTLKLPPLSTKALYWDENQHTTINDELYPYGFQAYDLPQGNYRIIFEGAEETSLVEPEPFSGEYMWWSYNGEFTAARLSRAIDLTEVASATLNYALWYALERDYDWGNIMISVDGRQTWKPLSTDQMKPPTEANGIPIQHYTGRSQAWLQESLDLTPYAGQKIWLRIETVTDGTFTQDGLLLDNIAIPEIGWFDDAETLDPDWQAEGFIRIRPTIPQNWVLGVIQQGDSSEVQWLSSEQTFTVEETGGIFVVGGMAPLTLRPASYKLVLEKSE